MIVLLRLPPCKFPLSPLATFHSLSAHLLFARLLRPFSVRFLRSFPYDSARVSVRFLRSFPHDFHAHFRTILTIVSIRFPHAFPLRTYTFSTRFFVRTDTFFERNHPPNGHVFTNTIILQTDTFFKRDHSPNGHVFRTRSSSKWTRFSNAIFLRADAFSSTFSYERTRFFERVFLRNVLSFRTRSPFRTYTFSNAIFLRNTRFLNAIILSRPLFFERIHSSNAFWTHTSLGDFIFSSAFCSSEHEHSTSHSQRIQARNYKIYNPTAKPITKSLISLPLNSISIISVPLEIL